MRVNDQDFNPPHFCKVFKVLRRDRVTKQGVVRSPGGNPGGCRDLETRARPPRRSRDRDPLERLLRRDGVDLVLDHAKAIAHVDEGRIDRRAGGSVKDQHQILFTAYDRRMDPAGGLIGGDRRANFQHVGAEHVGIARAEMVRTNPP